MREYIIRRLLLMPITLIGITFVVFCITRMVPSGPIERVLQEQAMGELSGEKALSNSATSGVSEADIEAEAKKYVKEDLVQLAVLRAEGIALTDDEKIKLLARYVKKYVDDYGYSEDYVRKNLTDEIYKSMLFDKMLEYLMLKNTFTVKE
jgi:ABC-type microcin C transport system permease subunit YejB